MKQTFIFEPDNHITEDDLYRLARVADRNHVSWTSQMTNGRYRSVQMFTTPQHMHDIAHMAGFSGEQLRHGIEAARRRGDAAVEKVSNRKQVRTLGEFFHQAILRRVVSELQDAGYDVAVEKCPDVDLHHVQVFGRLVFSGSSEQVTNFLLGIECVINRGRTKARQAKLQMPGGTKRSKRSA